MDRPAVSQSMFFSVNIKVLSVTKNSTKLRNTNTCMSDFYYTVVDFFFFLTLSSQRNTQRCKKLFLVLKILNYHIFHEMRAESERVRRSEGRR